MATDIYLTLTSIVLASLCSLASVIIGFLGFAFGVYVHFSNRKSANLKYSIDQLTDYDLPEGITSSIKSVPFSIEIKSVGNKQVENIRIRLDTVSQLEEFQVESSEEYQKIQDIKRANITLPILNPGETIKITGQCEKLGDVKDYIESLEVTHSEGVGEKASFW